MEKEEKQQSKKEMVTIQAKICKGQQLASPIIVYSIFANWFQQQPSGITCQLHKDGGESFLLFLAVFVYSSSLQPDSSTAKKISVAEIKPIRVPLSSAIGR